MAKVVVVDVGATWLADLRPGESLVVGRGAECDLRLSAPRASRRHLEIVARGAGHAVRDLASTNGTLVNGVPASSEIPLVDGDVLDAGGARLTYRSAP